MSRRTWEQTVAETLEHFINGHDAWRIVRRASRHTPPREYLGEVYLRIIRSKRCRLEFPVSTETEVRKRVWAIAPYHLRNAVRQDFSEAMHSSFEDVQAPNFGADEAHDAMPQIEDLVRALPEPLQSVVRMRLDARTLTDIAAIRCVSVGTISRQFQKAVEILKTSATSN